MKLKIKRVAVVGTGVIGAGWIIRFLANNIFVNVYDPDPNQKKILISEIKRTKKIIKKHYKNFIDLSNLKFADNLRDAVKDCDLIQENVPENEKLKIKIINQISLHAKKNAIISSSSSGLLPTKLQFNCSNPGRFLIAHPFNPVYLLPLVEIVKGKKTQLKYTNIAKKFYESIGMKTLVLKKEIEGYLSDRLQEAIWRESLHIINENYASTEELDEAIINGPGLRWSLMGTFLTFHLAGGKQGMSHMLSQFGPALKLPWTKLKAPKLTKSLSKKIINGTKQQAKKRSVDKLTNIRDNFLVDLLVLKNKYKI